MITTSQKRGFDMARDFYARFESNYRAFLRSLEREGHYKGQDRARIQRQRYGKRWTPAPGSEADVVRAAGRD